MAGKRGATSDLNHANWNQDDEPEERGSFQKASEESLKTRVIKTAKRRNPISSVRNNEDGDKKSAFAGFTAFQNKPPSTDFSFLTDTSKSDSSTKINGIDKPEITNSSFNIFTSTTSSSKTTNIFGAVPITTSISTNLLGSTSTSNAIVPSSLTGTNLSENYCAKLKGLNESVSKWIAKKVEENPLISLQPIFKDYEKYLDEIEKEEKSTKSQQKYLGNAEETRSVSAPINFTTSPKNVAAVPDSTSEKNNEKKAEENVNVPTFKFGVPATSSAISSAPNFSFGSIKAANGSKSFSSNASTSTLTLTPSFSFGSNNSSSGSLTFPTSTGFIGGPTKFTEADKPKDDADNEDKDDEPPKVEFKKVIEKDYIYTARCKVFVKKGDSFGDRGVGNLYLKPIEKSEKVQLIVRADTNLGNLLLNFILSENVPTKRMGKKDVMLVAIPTPDSQPPPVPLLLRVKTTEDADKLLEVLEKHKK